LEERYLIQFLLDYGKSFQIRLQPPVWLPQQQQ